MGHVSIQPLVIDRINSCLGLFDAQLREHDIVTSWEEMRNICQKVILHPEFGFLLEANCEETPVGVIFVAAHLSLELGGTVGWIEELYVVPASRGKGAGSMLLREATSRAKSLGWRGIELEIVAGHERVASLYLRHGFDNLSRTRFRHLFDRG